MARLGFLAVTPLTALLLAASGPVALAQSPPAARAAAPSPGLDAAKAAFEALPETDRKALQEALIWTGDYSGTSDGGFGRGTFDAIVAFQQRGGQAPNGVLTAQTRTALLAAGQQAKAAAGFTLVDDARTGVRIGVPAKILTKQDANPSGGSRWQSADDRITLDTRTAPPEATLQSLFDRNVAIQTPGRVVSYKVLRPDFFVIAGETATGRFYTRYASTPSGLRGFSLGYDKALAPQFDRIVVAIANSFVPAPVAAPPAPVAQAPALPKSSAARLVGTGLAIGARQVVTAAAACQDWRVEGLKAQPSGSGDILVLSTAEPLKAKPVALAGGVMQEGATLMIAAFGDLDGAPALTITPGRAAGTAMVEAALQPGAGGAPVLDQRRVLVGLVAPLPKDPRKVAGIVPATAYRIVPVSDLAGIAPEIIHQSGEAAPVLMNAADLLGTVQAALVPVTCAQ